MRLPGTDKRGSALHRRQRKHWLLAAFGTGKQCACVHCGKRLRFETVEADRIVSGGSYARHNIQPSCADCNKKRARFACHYCNSQVGVIAFRQGSRLWCDYDCYTDWEDHIS